MWKRYLLWFANDHVDFRYPEIHSLLSLFNIKMKWIENSTNDGVYWIVDLPSEDCARKLCSRSISLRWCIELWGRAKSPELLHEGLKKSLNFNSNQWHCIENDKLSSSCPRGVMEPFFRKDKSFKISVETFCRHFSLQEKIRKIETFSYIPFEGSIKLNKPDTEMMYLEYYGLDQNHIPEKPYDIFLGRLISDGQRQLITKLSLKTRKFIGNTSMDAQLSVLMANQAQIKTGDIVLDPFVGSGSLLVSAAEFGGYVWGTDIDFLMLHGRTRPSRVKQKNREKDESIQANMHQYKTQDKYLDVMVSDFSLPLWKDSMRFDAIITDPPYGIREPTEKIGINKENYTLSEKHLANHVPAKIDYNLTAIFSDLLSFAARYLAVGRRLVCWFPYYREDYGPEIIPTHLHLKVVANSEQVLSQFTARRLLTYEKVSEPTSDENGYQYPLFSLSIDGKNSKDSTPDRENGSVSDFRQKYFDSGEQTRKERKEQRANDKEKGKIQKALRLQRENLILQSDNCDGDINETL